MHYGPESSFRSSGLLAVALVAALVGACFDSDETFKSAATTGSTSGPGTTTVVDPTTTSSETTAMGETGPFDTCEDAIRCVNQCALSIQAMLAQDPDYEPDLGCFLECAETLSVDEVVKLFDLLNCASAQCKEMMQCETMPAGTDSGGSSSSSAGDDAGAEAEAGGNELLDPCLQCIFLYVSDPDPPGCEMFAMACE